MLAAESDVITGAKSLIFSVLLNILNNTLAMLSPVWDGLSNGTAPRLYVFTLKLESSKCSVALMKALPFLDDQISVVKLGLTPYYN